MSELFFQPTTAPGRDGQQPAPAPGPATEGAPARAPADASPPSIFSGPMLIMLALPILLLVFMTRNQNNKQKKLESGIKAGDRVLTRAGLIGKVEDVGERVIRLEIAPGVKVQVLKSAIEGLDLPDVKPESKDDKATKEAVSAKDAKDKDAKEPVKEKLQEKLQEKKA